MEEKEPAKGHKIIKEKDFYDTIWARLLSIFFLLLTAGIIVAMVYTENFKGTNLWRLNVVMIPGTLYMLVRSFGKKK